MRDVATAFCFFGLILGARYSPARELEEAEETKVERIGIYDSRAVAIAFIGSQVYEETAGKEMAAKMAEYREAQAEGNTERVGELKAWGKAQQALLHKQGFSTAPVDNILAHISDELPRIKKRASVVLLVSKWDTETLTQYMSAERVDVTMRLVEAFKPNQKQKKSAVEIQKHDPVPLEKLKVHRH
jgi:hypothetical protein